MSRGDISPFREANVLILQTAIAHASEQGLLAARRRVIEAPGTFQETTDLGPWRRLSCSGPQIPDVESRSALQRPFAVSVLLLSP